MNDNDIPLIIYESKVSSPDEIINLKKNLEINSKNKKDIKTNINTNNYTNLKYLKKTSPSKYNYKNLRSSTPEMNKLKSNFKSKKIINKKFSNSQNNFYNQSLLTESNEYNYISKPNKLRNEFQLLLGKLNNNSTKEIAFSQIKDLIKNNNTQNDLRIYISCLSTNNQTCSIGAKEIYALLYGLISNVYQENLMDPLDNPPNIIKTINRILNHIFKFYLSYNSYNIHKACALSICDIFENCMPKDNLKIIKMIFIESLLNLISIGTNKIIQNGAAICLSDFIFHIGKNLNENEIYNKILISINEKIINLCCRHSQDNPFIFEALYNLIFFTDIEIYNNNFKEIYDKISDILSENKDKFSINTKINCLNILNLIAIKAEKIADMSIGYYQDEIMKIIQLNVKDKNLKIQKSAKETLKNWIRLKEIYNNYDVQKRELNKELNFDIDKNKYNMKNSEFPVKKMDKLNFLRNLAKMSKIDNNTNNNVNFEKELTLELKNRVYDNGINNVIQLSNLIHNKKEKNAFSKGTNFEKEINNFLKNSNQVKKYNAYNLNVPIKNENKINNNNNNLNKEELQKISKEFSLKKEKVDDIENDKMNLYNENNSENENQDDYFNPIQQKKNEQNLNNIIDDFENNYQYDYKKNNMNLMNNNNFFDNNNQEINFEENNINNEKHFIINNRNINNERININEENENFISNNEINNLFNRNEQYIENNQFKNHNLNNQNQIQNNINSDLKLTFQNLFNNTLLKSFTDFENNINKKLYDMNLKINDISDKINEYKENQQNNQNLLNSIDSTKYYINNQQFKTNNNLENSKITKSNTTKTNIKKEKDTLKNKTTNNESDCQIIKNWKDALSLIDNNYPNEAYIKILNTGDDIYLLRLVCITGPIFNKLNPEISKRVLMRINMISRSHQIQGLLISLIRNSLKYKVFNLLNNQEKNDVLDSLYEFSGINNNFGSDAAELYTQITQNKFK